MCKPAGITAEVEMKLLADSREDDFERRRDEWLADADRDEAEFQTGEYRQGRW